MINGGIHVYREFGKGVARCILWTSCNRSTVASTSELGAPESHE